MLLFLLGGLMILQRFCHQTHIVPYLQMPPRSTDTSVPSEIQKSFKRTFLTGVTDGTTLLTGVTDRTWVSSTATNAYMYHSPTTPEITSYNSTKLPGHPCQTVRSSSNIGYSLEFKWSAAASVTRQEITWPERG